MCKTLTFTEGEGFHIKCTVEVKDELTYLEHLSLAVSFLNKAIENQC